MKFNTHKDLANEIEKKEMDQYKEVEKEIEEIEKRFLNEGEKIEKEEIEDMFADKEESEIKEILNSKNSNILNKIKEIIPNIKKLEIIKKQKEKEDIENEHNIKNYINKLNDTINLDKEEEKQYNIIINKIEEKYFEIKNQLISELNTNQELRKKLSKIQNNAEIIDLMEKKEEYSAQEINKSKEETETEQKENEELVIKNKDLMYKFENFLNKNKELNENNKELNEKVIEFKKINEIMSQDLEIEKRQKSILEQKFHNYENNEITLNVQIQEGLRENENLKKEFDVEIDNHEKTIKIIELLKEENKILKDKIRGLNTHISKLSESVHQLLKNNDDKDKYYPALFESSQIKKNDEIKKINIDLDGKDLQIQMKNNLISDLEDEIKLLKNQLDEKENYTANAIEKIIEKKLT